MTREMIKKSIIERIDNDEKGTLYIISDFLDLGSYDAAKMALSRLAKNDILKRVIRGIYQKPNYSTFLNEYIPASPEDLALAYARNYKWEIIPEGEAALNTLGLSTQVPASYEYVSSGPYKKIEYGGITIRYKNKTNRELVGISFKDGILMEAIKALGKDNITNSDRKKVLKKYSCEELISFKANNRSIRKWIYKEIDKIIELNGDCDEKASGRNP